MVNKTIVLLSGFLLLCTLALAGLASANPIHYAMPSLCTHIVDNGLIHIGRTIC